MMVPIASMTVAEMRQELAQRAGDARYNFGKRLIDEIARLRDCEVVVCHTRWHDHAPPPEVKIDTEKSAQLELLGLMSDGGKHGR